jgi:hypothetical protein
MNPPLQRIDTTASLARSVDSQSNLKGGLAGTSPGFPARLPRQTMSGLSGTRERRRRSTSDPASIPIWAFGAVQTVVVMLGVLPHLAVANQDLRHRRRPRAQPG